MARTATVSTQRKKAQRELHTARRTLTHLIEIYDNGQWRRLYREEVFIGTVRKAREAVDHWTAVLGRLGR